MTNYIDALYLADAAYDRTTISGFENTSKSFTELYDKEDLLSIETLGVDLQKKFSDTSEGNTGLSATISYNAQNNEYIFAFVGTENGTDWVSNFSYGHSQLNAFHKEYATFVTELKKADPSVKITNVGHSLGGALAEAATYIAEKNGVDATVFSFNGFGAKQMLELSDVGYDPTYKIEGTLYYAKGDIVSYIGDHLIEGESHHQIDVDEGLYDSHITDAFFMDSAFFDGHTTVAPITTSITRESVLSILQYIFPFGTSTASLYEEAVDPLFDHSRPDITTAFTDPLVLDLNGDGIELTAAEGGSAFFDIDADGFRERVGWVSAEDGLLVRDLNGNGTIDDISELIGNDNKINENDAVWNSLKVWQDANGNGVTDAGELKSLAHHKITKYAKNDNTLWVLNNQAA